MFIRYENDSWIEVWPTFSTGISGEDSGVSPLESRVLPASVGHGATSIGETIYYWGGTSGKHRLNGLWSLECGGTPDQWRWNIIQEVWIHSDWDAHASSKPSLVKLTLLYVPPQQDSVEGNPHAGRLGHAACAWKEKLLIAGGYVFKAVNNTQDHRVNDPTLNLNRYSFASVGTAAAHRVPISDLSIFDTVSRTWSRSTPVPEPRLWLWLGSG